MRVTVCAEVGINASGSLAHAIDLMRVAKVSGADVVKFQKRTVPLAVPPDMMDTIRQTPWGPLRMEDYKHKIEMGRKEYRCIDAASKEIGIPWAASAFDPPSVEFLARMDVPFIKVPSATITDVETLAACRDTGLPLVLSTGGSSWAEIDAAVEMLHACRLTLLHCTSVYPAAPGTTRILVMDELRQRYGLPVGYSGHEAPGSMAVTIAAVARGAVFVERHVTLSRHQWGSDQKASLEPAELTELVREIRLTSEALTTGAERPVDEAERKKIETMRRSSWAKKGEAA
jgi:N-acetylneuraminate synthase